VVGALALIATLLAGFLYWKQGEPYQTAYQSPNGQYYIQKYTVVFPFGIAGPGQGSDAAGGYIRLYNRNGQMLKERRQEFFRDIRPVWAKEKVYLLGIAEMDNDPWILPSSSE
jgi:hypothetical protein